jgi:hypothetical protein
MITSSAHSCGDWKQQNHYRSGYARECSTYISKSLPDTRHQKNEIAQALKVAAKNFEKLPNSGRKSMAKHKVLSTDTDIEQPLAEAASAPAEASIATAQIDVERGRR